MIGVINYRPGDYVKLLTDVKTYSKGGRVYGRAGETVLVKSTAHCPVILVVGKYEAFPVQYDDISKVSKSNKKS